MKNYYAIEVSYHFKPFDYYPVSYSLDYPFNTREEAEQYIDKQESDCAERYPNLQARWRIKKIDESEKTKLKAELTKWFKALD